MRVARSLRWEFPFQKVPVRAVLLVHRRTRRRSNFAGRRWRRSFRCGLGVEKCVFGGSPSHRDGPDVGFINATARGATARGR